MQCQVVTKDSFSIILEVRWIESALIWAVSYFLRHMYIRNSIKRQPHCFPFLFIFASKLLLNALALEGAKFDVQKTSPFYQYRNVAIFTCSRTNEHRFTTETLFLLFQSRDMWKLGRYGWLWTLEFYQRSSFEGAKFDVRDVVVKKSSMTF